jgi:hypothetical protein
MTVQQFERGYWYAEELKDFGRRIRIPGAAKLRKDELERAIATFLRTGAARLPTKRALQKTGVKDLERGLSLKRRIAHYTSNRETKDFIIREARKQAPDVREKSGVWYRLNRWREDQIVKGNQPTYGDLVQHYITLNSTEHFAKIPHARYINFLADFFAAEKGATRPDALAAWSQLKAMDVPKNYVSWAQARAGLGKTGRRSGTQ